MHVALGVWLVIPPAEGFSCGRGPRCGVPRGQRVSLVTRRQTPRRNLEPVPATVPVVRPRVEARFLPVWFTCVAADWLQGPYLYTLYADRRLSSYMIAKLFAVGFVSSAALGAIAGRLCDQIGRRRGCLLYCAICCVSCILTHSLDLGLLVFSRLLGGIADSLLHTAFEAWAIEEHKQCPAPPQALNRLLSRMWSGSWLVAIFSGIIGSLAVSALPRQLCNLRLEGVDLRLVCGGPVAAFDLAALCCVIGALLIMWTWPAQEPHLPDLESSIRWGPPKPRSVRPDLARWLRGFAGIRKVITDPVILYGAITAAFEGALFVFVFNWSPLLLHGWPGLAPHLGLVFALFMSCCAGGSFCFKYLSELWSPAKLLMPILIMASASLSGAAYAAHTNSALAALAACLLFEVAVGMYFPCTSSLKSDMVPDRIRGLVYSLYRVPLNMLALGVLLGVPSQDSALALCAVVLMLVAAWTAMVRRRGDSA
ncbi:unnamed protein product [Effrenium voratum]|uniref:Molybdate-anion transporter n=1 Tax=Effrenium voratum TaxID=2562239 RepID=A0AA36MN23_9DINO|nr:unnamed protein product [Effrenium voratum]